MYTQCPDCKAAYPVTAADLQRASGRMLCIRCEREFNALERLTEDAPAAATEIAPKSRAILESLRELTGPYEIRIEDTGVEWRVIDDEEVEGAAAISGNDDSGLRWIIEDDGYSQAPAPAKAPATERQQAALPLVGAAGEAGQQRYDDNTPLPDELDGDLEQEPPRRRAEDHIEPRSTEAIEAQVDLALGEADDWMDLLAEVSAESRGRSAAGDEPVEGPVEVPDDELGDEPVGEPHFPSDIDTQFDLQAIELGIDVTGRRKRPEHAAVDEAREQDLATDPATPDDAAPPSADLAATTRREVATADADELSLVDEDDGKPGRPQPAREDEDERRALAFEEELASAWSIASDDEPEPPGARVVSSGTDMPPPGGDESSINRQIDEDLLKLAEQQDVLRSTATGRHAFEDLPLMETIIMEGDLVRSGADEEPASGSPEGVIDNSSDLATTTDDSAAGETGITATAATSAHRRAGRHRFEPPLLVNAGAAALALLLAAQIMHANRGSLATFDAFDRTVGAIYRSLGVQITPDWDIKGWRFESTTGNTDELDEILTISSRLGNISDKALPYPLLHLSLTDRREEVVGSKVLSPDEYLGTKIDARVDARGHVPAGESFNAVVTLESPTADATGFKLNVCYSYDGHAASPAAGLANDRLRCAMQDFRY